MFKKTENNKYIKLVEYGKYYSLHKYDLNNEIPIKKNLVLKDTFENVLSVLNNVYKKNYKNYVFCVWYILINIKSKKYIHISSNLGKVYILSNDDNMYNLFFTSNKMITNIYNTRQTLEQYSKQELESP